MNTFLILSCTPFCPQNSLNSSGHGLYKVSKVFHRDAGPCWLMLHTVVSCWLDVLWVVDHSWYTQETVKREKPGSVAVLDSNRCTYYHAPFKCTFAIFCLSHSPSERPAHTIHVPIVSRLKNRSLTCLHPLHLPWLTSIRDHSFHLVSLWHRKSRCSEFFVCSMYILGDPPIVCNQGFVCFIWSAECILASFFNNYQIETNKTWMTRAYVQGKSNTEIQYTNSE